MRKWLQSALLVLLLILAFQSTYAQDQAAGDNTGPSGMTGIGYRFVPSALSPMTGYYTDPSLGTALFLRFWVNEFLGIELGGWAYTFEDAWTKNSNTLVSGGLLYKLASLDSHDFKLAARGIQYTTKSEGSGYYCPIDDLPVPAPGETRPGAADVKPGTGPIMPPCWPSGGSRSKSTTLAIEGTVGVEWKPIKYLGLDFEFGMIYTQTVTTNEYAPPVPMPPVEPPVVPVQAGTTETFASSVLSPVMHFGVILYIF